MQGIGEWDTAVKKIADDDEALDFMPLNQVSDAIKVRLALALWHGDAMGSECGGFSKVDIGKHQSVAGGPERGPFGKQYKFFASENNLPRSFFKHG